MGVWRLPRKTDMERKIEIYNFSARTRQLFIRLLALVKWANSASKVDKSAVSSHYNYAPLPVSKLSVLSLVAHNELSRQTINAVRWHGRHVGQNGSRNISSCSATKLSYSGCCWDSDNRNLLKVAGLHPREDRTARSNNTEWKASDAATTQSGYSASAGHRQFIAANEKIQGTQCSIGVVGHSPQNYIVSYTDSTL